MVRALVPRRGRWRLRPHVAGDGRPRLFVLVGRDRRRVALPRLPAGRAGRRHDAERAGGRGQFPVVAADAHPPRRGGVEHDECGAVDDRAARQRNTLIHIVQQPRCRACGQSTLADPRGVRPCNRSA